MHLKRLELVGFKSFAHKTALDFPGGITAIVGPNGAGKSNIIDAFRWLLGEREAKNMRGGKAQDLIFAGTPKTPAVSLAQATMVFDNHDHFFPVDYTEVSIRRRVTRDGNSTYLLNESEVRLKDVLDFFAKSRLGTKGFSIINQGESDLFVRATPEERRGMLEEMLGLRQFQIKKHDTELKLKGVAINLEKVNALVEEMAPHLRLLRKTSARWGKHAEFDKELMMLEGQYFAARLKELEREKERFAPQRKAVEGKLKEKHDDLRELEKQLKAVEQAEPGEDSGAFSEISRERTKLLNEKTELQRELGKLDAHLEMAGEEKRSPADTEKLVHFLEELRENLHSLAESEDPDEIKSFLQQIVAEIDALLHADLEGEDIAKKLEGAKEKIEAQLSTIEEGLEAVQEAEKKFANRLQHVNAEFKRAYGALQNKRNEMNALESERNALLLEEERVGVHVEELVREMKERGKTKEDVAGVTTPADFSASDASRRILRLRGELASIGDIDPALLKETEEMETRHAFLTKQVKDLEQASKDLTRLVGELDQKIHSQFNHALTLINQEFQKYFEMIFGGGRARLVLEKFEPPHNLAEGEVVGQAEDSDAEHPQDHGGLQVEISIPRKKIRGLEMLSGGERSMVSIAALFSLISVSPPPFIVLDEVDAALDEVNTRRFAEVISQFSKRTQFVIVTHNRSTMEVADVLYGVTMKEDGTSRVLSLKLE